MAGWTVSSTQQEAKGTAARRAACTCLARGPSSEGKTRRLLRLWISPGAQENAFVRHMEDFHLGEEGEVQFKLEVVRNFSKSMGRLVCEGCHIMSSEADTCMNGKLDHFRPEVGKVVISNMIHTGRRRNRNTG